MKIKKKTVRKIRKNPRYVDSLEEIAKQANQDPQGKVDIWLDKGDYVLLSENEKGEVTGFCIFKMIPRLASVYIVSMMIRPEYQNKGIMKEFFRKVIKTLLFNFYHFLLNPLMFYKIYLVFRTQSPRVFYSLKKRFETYPSIKNIESYKIRRLAVKLSDKLWPGVSFNDNNFVLKDAYSQTPGLALSFENIQWSNDEETNDMFKKRLELKSDEKSFDSMLVLCELKTYQLILCQHLE